MAFIYFAGDSLWDPAVLASAIRRLPGSSSGVTLTEWVRSGRQTVEFVPQSLQRLAERLVHHMPRCGVFWACTVGATAFCDTTALRWPGQAELLKVVTEGIESSGWVLLPWGPPDDYAIVLASDTPIDFGSTTAPIWIDLAAVGGSPVEQTAFASEEWQGVLFGNGESMGASVRAIQLLSEGERLAMVASPDFLERYGEGLGDSTAKMITPIESDLVFGAFERLAIYSIASVAALQASLAQAAESADFPYFVTSESIGSGGIVQQVECLASHRFFECARKKGAPEWFVGSLGCPDATSFAAARGGKLVRLIQASTRSAGVLMNQLLYLY